MLNGGRKTKKLLKEIKAIKNENVETVSVEKCCPTCKFDIYNSGKHNKECEMCGASFKNWSENIE